MTSQQLKDIYALYLQYPVIITDSRNCLPDSIFVALKGDNFNGNAFAQKALEQGCAYAIVDEAEYAGDSRIILVNDCLKTLQDLANYHRKQFKGKVIGITGTNGKTTTKELTAAVLSKKYKTLFTQGNLNNHIGVPLTLLRLTNDYEFAIIEMGASHQGEIKTLCEICEPDFGLITNVGRGHLEGFGSFEGVIKTKGELYDFIRAKNGKIFINHDNEYLQKISIGLNKVEYGNDGDVFVSGKVIDSSPYLSFEWKTKNVDFQSIKTQLVGEYNLENALAAATIGLFFDVEISLINDALTEYTPQNNRSQLKKTADNSLIIDAYNANPSSMKASLMNFKNMKINHKAVILGDMLELGEESEKDHQDIVDFLNECQFEKVFLVGKCFASTKHTFEAYLSITELIQDIPKYNLKDFTILIKGSRALKLEKVIDCL